MIQGYEEFRESRDHARAVFRDALAAQSLDQSNRGGSVWQAYRNMQVPAYIVPLPRNWRRIMWENAYREQRIRDRAHRKRIEMFSKSMMPLIVDHITKPPKLWKWK